VLGTVTEEHVRNHQRENRRTLEEETAWRDLGVDGRVVIKRRLKKMGLRM
jgi:hypothetical protein